MSSRPTITLMTATFGRTTVADLAMAVVPQLKEGDEFIVVGDGPQPFSRQVCEMIPGVTYMETPEHKGDYGCTPWDYAIERAKGDYIMFIGDDDLPTGHAFEIVRRRVGEDPHKDAVYVFAMLHTGNILRGTTAMCQVSNQQVVVPRELALQVKYADCPKENILVSDWVWINKIEKLANIVNYHDEIICVLEKQNFGKML